MSHINYLSIHLSIHIYPRSVPSPVARPRSQGDSGESHLRPGPWWPLGRGAAPGAPAEGQGAQVAMAMAVIMKKRLKLMTHDEKHGKPYENNIIKITNQ